ncbi:MAG TPA: hypothetical protein VNV82_05665 [Bryobacteraceae bacterium]|jgi:hypothetical protein|nr:hypothetical protein [Bryobacteraceae bacterium]
MRSKVIFAAIVIVTFTASLGAQSKPNFSGTWKLNVEKSDFGVLPPSNSRTDVIDHQEPNLKDSVSDDGAQGQQNYTLSMTTDGKEAVNKPGGLDMKSTAAWAANSLVVNAKLQFQGSDVVIKTTWALSDDGKMLTENVHLESPMGETDQKMVFEKQEGGATAVAGMKPAAVAGSASGAKPNYSGTWKLNVAKSDFGPIPGPDTRTDVIEHNDPTLKVSTAQEGAQGKQEYTLNMTTDGKEMTNTPGGLEVKSIGGWEANNLVMNIKLRVQDNDVAAKTTWLLSEDGKTLTQNQHLSTAMGELDQKMVFEKQ